MVENSGAAVRAHQLRALNRPVPIEVQTGAGSQPLVVEMESGWVGVAVVLERWRVDDLWWREDEQLSRMYHELELTDGRIVTIYQDRRTGAWYRQPYG